MMYQRHVGTTAMNLSYTSLGVYFTDQISCCRLFYRPEFVTAFR